MLGYCQVKLFGRIFVSFYLNYALRRGPEEG